MIGVDVVLQKKIEEIQKAIEQGKRVFWGDVEVKSIRIEKSRRGYIVIINESEIIYPSRFLLRKVLVV